MLLRVVSLDFIPVQWEAGRILGRSDMIFHISSFQGCLIEGSSALLSFSGPSLHEWFWTASLVPHRVGTPDSPSWCPKYHVLTLIIQRDMLSATREQRKRGYLGVIWSLESPS